MKETEKERGRNSWAGIHDVQVQGQTWKQVYSDTSVDSLRILA